jgi:hypothetical protein
VCAATPVGGLVRMRYSPIGLLLLVVVVVLVAPEVGTRPVSVPPESPP